MVVFSLTTKGLKRGIKWNDDVPLVALWGIVHLHREHDGPPLAGIIDDILVDKSWVEPDGWTCKNMYEDTNVMRMKLCEWSYENEDDKLTEE